MADPALFTSGKQIQDPLYNSKLPRRGMKGSQRVARLSFVYADGRCKAYMYIFLRYTRCVYVV
jgi:hypothetical protein